MCLCCDQIELRKFKDDVAVRAEKWSAVVPTPEDARPIPDYLEPPSMGFLIDAWVKGAHGGTGQTLSHETARVALQHRRGFLAGGLTPLNAYDIIRALHPFGVDVASGVEIEPGIKDRLLMQRFVTAAGAACQD